MGILLARSREKGWPSLSLESPPIIRPDALLGDRSPLRADSSNPGPTPRLGTYDCCVGPCCQECSACVEVVLGKTNAAIARVKPSTAQQYLEAQVPPQLRLELETLERWAFEIFL